MKRFVWTGSASYASSVVLSESHLPILFLQNADVLARMRAGLVRCAFDPFLAFWYLDGKVGIARIRRVDPQIYILLIEIHTIPDNGRAVIITYDDIGG